MFVGIALLGIGGMFAFGVGIAEEQLRPDRQKKYRDHKSFYFWSWVVTMIAAGILLTHGS